MALITWEPFTGVDHVIDERFLSLFTRPSWDLPVDVYETDGQIVTKMSLPEINIEDVEVTMEDNMITVSGKREEETESNKKDYYSKEIRRGTFSRTIRLPKSVTGEQATAVYKNGILEVTAPIRPSEDQKKIPITVT